MKLHKRNLRHPVLGTAVMLAALATSGCKTMEEVGSNVNSGLQQFGQRIDAGMARLSNPRESDEASVTPITLPPAERRDYRQGDVFIYDNGRVHRVMASNKGFVVWGNADRETFRTSKHFFLPRIQQKYDNRIMTRRFSGNIDALWPLKPGKRVSFKEQRQTFWPAEDRKSVVTRDWNCEVEDARVTVVPAGSYDTYRVTCRSYRAGRFSALNMGPIQTVHWDYAPTLGHFVRRERVSGKSNRVRVQALNASLPASLATPDRIAATVKRVKTSRN